MGQILKTGLLKKIEHALKNIYYNPKHPSSFSGINKLYQTVKKYR